MTGRDRSGLSSLLHKSLLTSSEFHHFIIQQLKRQASNFDRKDERARQGTPISLSPPAMSSAGTAVAISVVPATMMTAESVEVVSCDFFKSKLKRLFCLEVTARAPRETRSAYYPRADLPRRGQGAGPSTGFEIHCRR